MPERWNSSLYGIMHAALKRRVSIYKYFQKGLKSIGRECAQNVSREE